MSEHSVTKIDHANHLLLVRCDLWPLAALGHMDSGFTASPAPFSLLHSSLTLSSRLNQDQSLVRLPYELLHKNFRAAHFTVAKEGSFITQALKDAANASLKGGASHEDVLKNLDSVIARMHGVKRKLAACADEEARLYRQIDARVKHLDDLQDMHAFEDVKYEQWSRKRLDRLLVDYLMRQGYGDSARALAGEKGIVDLVDIETFEQMNRIRQSLLNQSVKEALDWCTENKKELRKNDVSSLWSVVCFFIMAPSD